MDVLEAMQRRASTRAFLDKPVDRATVESILEAARWAPSGTNAQPWQVVVVTGAIKKKIGGALLAERQAGRPDNPDYHYYPKQWVEPYKSRRVACGLALYQALKISRDDKDARLKAWNNNYSFFGAPVGLLFFVDRALEKGSWMDMGMFIQNVMLAALGHGLATCPQASIAEYPDIVRAHVNVAESRALVCGMALGYPDTQAPVNNYRTAREPVDQFTSWRDA